MNCSDLETLLCDYVDGTLGPGRKAEVESHLSGCPACAETARDAAAAVAFMERAAEVEPPPELITRILFELPATQKRASGRPAGFRAALGRLLEPVLQPRFAMGMAMTILSFSMIARVAGINVRQLQISDLDPVRVWEAVDRRIEVGYQRVVKFYESLRFVYELRSRLSELTEKEDVSAPREEAAPNSGAKPRKPAGQSPPESGP